MPSVAIRPPVSGRTRPSSAGFGGLNQGWGQASVSWYSSRPVRAGSAVARMMRT